MEIDYVSIGSRIKYHRMKKGFSQEELADRTELSRVHISCIERGERIASLEAIVGIANALNTSVDSLLAESLFLSGNETVPHEMDVLLDCTPEESAILVKSMVALKKILRSYKITK